MPCPSCGRAVRAGSRFCGACGASWQRCLAEDWGPLIQRYEFFDVGDSEWALARFEELCAGLGEKPLEIAPR
ncbi:MAG: zinc-ribbon domain-containing protein [Terriglobales bacterium]